MKRILLIFCMLPLTLFSQTYGFNRQSIMKFTNAKDHKDDMWLIPIEIEIQSKFIIMRRPPNGVGEKELIDTLIIVSKTKGINVTRFTTKDGRTVCIYHDKLITMCTKEQSNGARTEYCFYNQ